MSETLPHVSAERAPRTATPQTNTPRGIGRRIFVVVYFVLLLLPIYWLALAIQRLGPTQTAAVGNLGPVLTVLASWAILSEQISLYQVAGMALVLLGVTRLKPPAKKSAEAQAEGRGGEAGGEDGGQAHGALPR